jgi:hypothetical protein
MDLHLAGSIDFYLQVGDITILHADHVKLAHAQI